MSKVIDLTGQRFGRLTVIERTENHRQPNGKTVVMWRCKCDCGNIIKVKGISLRNGYTQSCGCYQREHVIKHGLSYSKIYSVWGHMKNRCYNPNNPKYKKYGARGIKVCDRWRNSFEVFYEDVSKLPHFGESGYSLDRIDNNGNYEPNNVRWATAKEQNNNRIANRIIKFNNKTQTLTQWAKEMNINHNTIKSRLRMGWSIEKSLTTPIQEHRKKTASEAY